MSTPRAPLLCFHGRGRLIVAALTLSVVTAAVQAQTPTPTEEPSTHSVIIDADQPAQTPAHLANVTGAVSLERNARVQPATVNLPLLAGDRLRTDAGRVTVRFGSGSTLDLEQFSEVDLRNDSLLQLLSGAVHVVLVSTSACPVADAWCLTYRIDAAPGAVVLHTAGDYRVALSNGADDPRIDLSVEQGSATLQNSRGTVLVGAEARAWAVADVPPSQPLASSSSGVTPDDQLAAARHTARVTSPPAPPPLPAELADYAAELDRDGSWRAEVPYGSVWYPRVGPGWRPYSSGQWSFAPSLGWTWVGIERWSWPTHHYGRWGLNGKGWYWVPGNRWAPAWVAWAYTPQYVSWCPLGPNGAAAILPTSARSAAAWSVLPAQMFATGAGRPGRAAPPRTLTPTLRTSLDIRPTPPPAAVHAGPVAAPLIGPLPGRPTVVSPSAPATAGSRIGAPAPAAPTSEAGARGPLPVLPAGALPPGTSIALPRGGAMTGGGASSGAPATPPAGGTATSHIGPAAPSGQGNGRGR